MSQNTNLEEVFVQVKDTLPDIIVGGRVAKGLSQEELAEKLAISKAELVRLECKEIDLSFEMLGRICSAIEYTVVEVLKVAVEASRLTEREKIETIVRETDYEIWRRQQDEL